MRFSSHDERHIYRAHELASAGVDVRSNRSTITVPGIRWRQLSALTMAKRAHVGNDTMTAVLQLRAEQESAGLHVPRGYTVRIEEPCRVTVVCTSGRIWMTQLGDNRDHVMDAGEERKLRDRGSVLLYGMMESRCRIVHDRSLISRIVMNELERCIYWSPVDMAESSGGVRLRGLFRMLPLKRL